MESGPAGAVMMRRLHRLALTFIAKKYVAWGVATWLLVQGYLSGQEWVLLTASVFLLDLATKIKVPQQEVPNAVVPNCE